jgi:hypothetical protein
VSIEAVRRRLVDDYPYYARTVLKVVDRGRVVPFIFRPAQHDLWTLLKAQRDDGQPMRAIILKARKLGFSTFAQGLILQRTTLHPYHISTVIAHNAPTAAAILSVAETMYSHLPEIADAELTLKPPIANRRRQKEIRFGERDRFTGADANQTFGTGQSSLTVDTAREFEGGRGFTFHSIHGSEVGFWPDQKRKLTALRNAVDSTDPNTLILLESTANGHNEFKVMCDMAQAGEGDYPLFFAGWHADPRYRRPLTARQLDRFVIGDESSPFAGEDEAELCERYGLDIEQLHWRRWAIEHLCASDVNIFRQEYPSFPEEAFLATGQTVFGGILIQKALRDTSKAPEPKLIELEQAATMTRKTRRGTVDVPTAVKVTPHGPWEVWAEPSESGQYVIGLDPASGEDGENAASFAIVVIDHNTRMQVAQFEGILDPDLVAKQAMLACLWYSRHRRPWLAVERTGGYGLAIIDILYHDYGWRQMYTKRRTDAPTGTYADRIGWDTTRATKGLLHEEAMALLREGAHGIQSTRLARQMETYVRRGTGRTGPQPGARSDLLLAWMIAQTVASEKPPRVERKQQPHVRQRRVRYAVTGY